MDSSEPRGVSALIITSLRLRNYRVYEDLDIELPVGLVGVYGPNGAGKSYLVESIPWALFGHARTAKDEVRSSGVGDDCAVEVCFEHEGHSYAVRRVITGVGSSVRAQAEADGLLVAEGVREVVRYVHSILGMDDSSFRASVFAEQKQLAAFSARRPAERRELVLGLLGVTPLDAARDAARKDARAQRDQVDRLRLVLADREELKKEEADARGELQRVTTLEEEARLALQDVSSRAERSREALVAFGESQRAWQRLCDEGLRAKAELSERTERLARLRAESEGLGEARARLAGLEDLAATLDAAEARRRALGAVHSAQEVLSRLPELSKPQAPPPERVGAELDRLNDAVTQLATLDATLKSAREAETRAEEAWRRAEGLSSEAECPLCGQELGKSFLAVQDHRMDDLDEARGALVTLERERDAVVARAEEARASYERARQEDQRATKGLESWQRSDAARQEALHRLAEALAALGHEPSQSEAEEVAAEVTRARRASEEAAELRGRLAREAPLALEIDREAASVVIVEGRLESLRTELRELGYSEKAHQAAESQHSADTKALEMARERMESAAKTRGEAAQLAAIAAGKLSQAEEQHEGLRRAEDEARHLGRAAELLSAFRNNVVASVGPRLAAQAAELFAELTDNEYDRLEVDPETYELRIRDQGIPYGMDRFSGSESDLANLALRIAISEQVRFQSGGAVGLLVLDEVFGPLDDDRRERMLLALERLRARFRQVLVVTHSEEVKQRLPQAIEVRKLPGRRAEASLVV